MTDLAAIAPSFVEMAHRIVWATVATTDTAGRPRSRILHPLWEWDGSSLVGWIGTSPTPVKRAHLERTPYVSVSYWAPDHDTCVADCRVEWFLDDATRERVWRAFEEAPAPVGYDPAIIPAWRDGPRGEGFAALRLEPYRLRVFPGSGGEIRTWSMA